MSMKERKQWAKTQQELADLKSLSATKPNPETPDKKLASR
jgi:hypothetical protein